MRSTLFLHRQAWNEAVKIQSNQFPSNDFSFFRLFSSWIAHESMRVCALSREKHCNCQLFFIHKFKTVNCSIVTNNCTVEKTEKVRLRVFSIRQFVFIHFVFFKTFSDATRSNWFDSNTRKNEPNWIEWITIVAEFDCINRYTYTRSFSVVFFFAPKKTEKTIQNAQLHFKLTRTSMRDCERVHQRSQISRVCDFFWWILRARARVRLLLRIHFVSFVILKN